MYLCSVRIIQILKHAKIYLQTDETKITSFVADTLDCLTLDSMNSVMQQDNSAQNLVASARRFRLGHG